jgi:hypothetical protein
MSDQPQYRRDATQPSPGQYRVEDPAWARPGGIEPVQAVKLDRPLYTGMMFGFGLMLASIVLIVIMSVVFGVVGVLLGRLTTATF